MSNLAGTWNSTMKTPMGDMQGVWFFEEAADGTWGGTNSAMGSSDPWLTVTVDGDNFTADYEMTMMGMKMAGVVKGVIGADGTTATGQVVTSMGASDFTAVKA